MNRQQLIQLIKEKKSFLCVGLDTDPERIPVHIQKKYPDDPVFAFNRMIIDATIGAAVAYKPNLAFYEARGSKGWKSLEKTMAYLSEHPKGPVFTIADAKRADIGNTSLQYAGAFFEHLGFDAVTVNPYLGHDAVKPFLSYEGKWAIILALTSNPGSIDFQVLQPQLPTLLEKLGIKTCYWKKLFELVIEESSKWGNLENTMYVVGATHPEMLDSIREIIPEHFLLIPGVGAQGGDLDQIAQKTLTKDGGILVNLSRTILYASQDEDFAEKAKSVAEHYHQQMQEILTLRNYPA